MNALIPAVSFEIYFRLKETRIALERYVSPDVIANFKLPQAAFGKNRKLVVPVSGGSDSSCMAVVMRTLFPNEELHFAFCDTGAESQDLHHNLSTLEDYLGIHIHRIIPERDLFELIEDYNGFLPSQKARWCTKILKIESLDNWLADKFDLENDQVFTFVGLRADEDRFGYVSDDPAIQMRLPYHDLSIGRAQVYGLLSDTVGIAKNYQYNSRSSCFTCFFKRRSERIGLLIHRADEFKKTASLEKLTAEDLARFDNLYHVFHGSKGMDLQLTDYFIPSAVDIRSANLPHPPKPIKHVDKETIDLFDFSESSVHKSEYDEIYCAVALLVHPLMNLYGGPLQGSTGVYRQDFVSYSPTLSGMDRALTFYWEHRLNTPEVWGLSQDQLREHLKIAVYQIKVPKGIIDLDSVSNDSYTWQSGEAYVQVERHVRLIHQALRLEALRQQLSEYQKLSERADFELTWEYEQIEGIQNLLSTFADSDLGSFIAWSGVFSPPSDSKLPSYLAQLRLENDPETRAESSIACVSCSL